MIIVIATGIITIICMRHHCIVHCIIAMLVPGSNPGTKNTWCFCCVTATSVPGSDTVTKKAISVIAFVRFWYREAVAWKGEVREPRSIAPVGLALMLIGPLIGWWHTGGLSMETEAAMDLIGAECQSYLLCALLSTAL